MPTAEELKQEYIDSVAEFKRKAWLKYQAGLFFATGDTIFFNDAFDELFLQYHLAAIEYEHSGDRDQFLKDREENCSKAYEQRLVDAGLAERILTDKERAPYVVGSWLFEKDANVKMDPTIDQREACCVGFRMTRRYLYEVHKKLVPALKGREDVRPTRFASKYQKQVWDEPLTDPYVDFKPSKKELEDYENAKNRRI